MQIKVLSSKLENIKCDILAIGIFEDEKKLSGAALQADKAVKGMITRLVKEGEICGKPGEITVIHCISGLKAKKIAVIGLGKKEDLDLEGIRIASSKVINKAKEIKAGIVAIVAFDLADSAKALVEGAILGGYKFSGYAKEKEPLEFIIDELFLVEWDKKKIKAANEGAELGRIIAEAENHARDLVNAPSNKMTPTAFAKLAQGIAKVNKLKFTLLDPESAGMECLMAVAKGSNEPPKLVAIEYIGNPKSKEKIALIGKGITFDSGGISLKPSKNMGEMKTDMAGAAAVLGIMSLLSDLKPKKNVVGVIPLTENMPSGHAV
ncbi:MAG: leucyl aminopeptidase, partial [Candidatus Saganbacteria bacterium]